MTRVLFVALCLATASCRCGSLLDVDLVVQGSGRIVGEGVDCSSRCTIRVPQSFALSAIAEAGWRFRAWSGPCASDGLSCAVNGSGTIVVSFEEPTVLVVEVVGAGSVSSADGSSCTEARCEWPAAEARTLVPTPDTGWRFARYEDGCTGTQCVIAAGRVVVVFEPVPAPLTIRISGTGTGKVVDRLGRFECSSNCDAFPTGSVELVPVLGTDTTSATFSGACNASPCVVQAPATVEVTFTKGRRVFSAVGGTGAGTIRALPAINCPGSCEATLDPASSLLLRAQSQGSLSRFVAWDGGCEPGNDPSTCLIGPGVGDVFVEARFDGQLMLRKSLPILNSAGRVGGGFVRLLEGNRLVLTWSLAKGLTIDGVAYAPDAPLFYSAGVASLSLDGGVDWVSHHRSTIDGGVVQLVPSYIREFGGALVVGGSCGSTSGPVCMPGSNFVMEFDRQDGGLLVYRSLGSSMTGAFRELGAGPFASQDPGTGQGSVLYSFQNGAASASTRVLPMNLLGCASGNPAPCLISWRNGFAWQGCSGSNALGLSPNSEDAALVEWLMPSQTCNVVQRFSSTPLAMSRVTPEAIVRTASTLLVLLTADAAELDARTTTPPGRQFMLGAISDAGTQWLASPGGGQAYSPFQDDFGLSFVETTSAASRTVLGVQIPANSSALFSVDRRPALRRALIFEGAWALSGHSHGGRTVLAVTGTDVRFEGESLGPGPAIHVLVFEDR